MATIVQSVSPASISNAAHWVGGVAPQNGDSISIIGDVSIDVDITLGTDAASTLAISGNTAAKTVTIEEDVTLTLLCGLTLTAYVSSAQTTYLRGMPGASIVYAGSYANTALISAGGADNVGRLDSAATEAKPFVITDSGSGSLAWGTLGTANYRQAAISGSYIRFVGSAYQHWGGPQVFDHVTWDETSGGVIFGGLRSTDVFRPVSSSQLNPSATFEWYYSSIVEPDPGIAREIVDCVILGTYYQTIGDGKSPALVGGYFGGSILVAAGADALTASGTMFDVPTNTLNSTRHISGCFVLGVGPNFHFIWPSAAAAVTSWSVTDCVFQAVTDGSIDKGDLILVPSSESTQTGEISGCIELLSSYSEIGSEIPSGTRTYYGNSNLSVSEINNTFFSYANIGETTTGPAAIRSRNNIGAGTLYHLQPTATPITVVDADYNGSAAETVYESGITYSPDPPGEHDVTVDSGISWFRPSGLPIGIEAWAAEVLGCTEETQDDRRAFALAALAAMNDAGSENYNELATPENLTLWCRRQFIPRSLAYLAGDPGEARTYIGALEPEIENYGNRNIVKIRRKADVMILRTHTLEATSGAIDWTFFEYSDLLLERIVLNFDAAPTTEENILVTIKSASGASYDQTVSESDPVGETSFLIDLAQPMVPGDSVNVTYANTDENEIAGIAYLRLY